MMRVNINKLSRKASRDSNTGAGNSAQGPRVQGVGLRNSRRLFRST